MTGQRTDNPLGYEKISTLLRSFAVPSIIAMLVSSLYNVVDQVFIGRGVGFRGNAATNVAFPLTTICMAITLTLSIGSASRFSLYLGQKREKQAAEAAGSGILMLAIFGTVYAGVVEIFLLPLLNAFGATKEVLPYAIEYTRITAIGMPFLMLQNGMSTLARADGSPMFSMFSMVVGAVINTILDPIFIFVFHLGVAGAAWATIIGQIVSCIFALTYLKRFKRIKLSGSCFKLSLKQLGMTAAMGMSNGLTQLAITLVQVVMNRSMVYYGRRSVYGSDIPLGASGIVMKVNAIVLAVIIGITQGMQPIVGFNYGAKKYSRVRAVYKLAIACELMITVVGLLTFEIFPRQVLLIFGKDESRLYYEFAVIFMRTFLMLLPLSGIQMISSNFFSAIGKPLKGALLSLTRQVFFLIPLVLILPVFFGIRGIMYAAPCADLMAFLVVMFFILKEMNRMKQLEKEQ